MASRLYGLPDLPDLADLGDFSDFGAGDPYASPIQSRSTEDYLADLSPPEPAGSLPPELGMTGVMDGILADMDARDPTPPEQRGWGAMGMKALEGVGHVFGAGKQVVDTGARAVARQLGLAVPSDMTTEQMMREAAGLSVDPAAGQGPMTTGQRLAGRALEFGTAIATDPLTPLLGGGGRLGKIAAGAFVPGMVVGAGQELGQTFEDVAAGDTPAAAEHALGALLSGGMGVAAGLHAFAPAKAPVVPRPLEKATDLDFLAGDEMRAPVQGVYAGAPPAPQVAPARPAPLQLDLWDAPFPEGAVEGLRFPEETPRLEGPSLREEATFAPGAVDAALAEGVVHPATRIPGPTERTPARHQADAAALARLADERIADLRRREAASQEAAQQLALPEPAPLEGGTRVPTPQEASLIDQVEQAGEEVGRGMERPQAPPRLRGEATPARIPAPKEAAEPIPAPAPVERAPEQRLPEERRTATPADQFLNIADQRVAQRRSEIARRYQLPADHPAVEAIERTEVDPLTGLPNKRAHEREMGDWGGHASLDVAGLKSVNDLYGHGAGDRFLQDIAHQLRDVAEAEGARVYRRGESGDEFAIGARDEGEAHRIAKLAKDTIAQRGILVIDEATQKPVAEFPGARVDYGYAADFDSADRHLTSYRSRAEARGERVPYRPIRERTVEVPEGDAGPAPRQEAEPPPRATEVAPGPESLAAPPAPAAPSQRPLPYTPPAEPRPLPRPAPAPRAERAGEPYLPAEPPFAGPSRRLVEPPKDEAGIPVYPQFANLDTAERAGLHAAADAYVDDALQIQKGVPVGTRRGGGGSPGVAGDSAPRPDAAVAGQRSLLAGTPLEGLGSPKQLRDALDRDKNNALERKILDAVKDDPRAEQLADDFRRGQSREADTAGEEVPFDVPPPEPVSTEAAEGTTRARQLADIESRQRAESNWQQLMRARGAAEAGRIADGMSAAEARTALERLDAAPGDNPTARAALEARATELKKSVESSVERLKALRGQKPVDAARVASSLALKPDAVRDVGDGFFEATLPNGKTFQVRVDSEGLAARTREGVGAAHPEGGEVTGALELVPHGAVAWLSKIAPEGTLKHEGWHYLKSLMPGTDSFPKQVARAFGFAKQLALTDKEREAVRARYEPMARKTYEETTGKSWADVSERLKNAIIEEHEADGYAQWRPSKGPNSWFSKIAAMFQRLYRTFKPTWESAFERASKGEAYGRAEGSPMRPALDVEAAAARVAAAPSPAQMEAGNYAKGHLKWQGLDVALETAKGGTRTAKDGSWQVDDYPAHYGYVKRTLGKDGDPVDVFIGDQPDAPKVWVVDQKNLKTGGFDEHKALLGFPDRETALDTYKRAYNGDLGEQLMGDVTEMGAEQFKNWARAGDTSKPLAGKGGGELPPALPRATAPAQPPPGPSAPTNPLTVPRVSVPEETWLQHQQRTWQDRLNRLGVYSEELGKAFEPAAKEAGEKVYRRFGAVQSEASAKLKALDVEHVTPWTEYMGKEKLQVTDLDDYMYAKQAPAANSYLQSIDPAGHAELSGMSNTESARILSDFASRGLTPKLERAAQMFQSMRKLALDARVEGGLMSRTQADAWLKEMPDWSPLRTERDPHTGDVTPLGTGMGFDIRGLEARHRLGRRTKADSPTAFMLQDVQRAIVRGEKNKANQEFGKLVKQYNLFPMDVEHMRREKGPDGMVREVRDALRDQQDFHYKVNGESHRIDVASTDPILHRQLTNASAKEMGVWLQHAAKATRLYSRLATTYNFPEFLLTNFTRDIQTAVGNVLAEHGGKPAAQTLKNVIPAMRGMMQALRDPTARTGWAKTAREFQEDGGQIGWYNVKDIPDLERELNSRVKAAGPGTMPALRRTLNKVGTFVEDINSSVENGTRLALYKALRDANVPREKAGSIARNVTVDFTKRGEAGPAMNALYAFFNANIQGGKRMAEVVLSRRGAKLAAGFATTALVLDQYNRSIAEDSDNDGTNDYDDIPEYVKRSNLVLMRGKGQNPFLIPMPYGFNVVYTAGRKLSETMSGSVKPGQAGLDLMAAAGNAFNPLGSDSDLVQAMTPTMLDPAVQHVMNRDFAGRRIVPEQLPSETKKPDSELYFRNVAPWARELAKMLNSGSGGDKVTPGFIDVSPETMEHYMTSYLAGVGRTGTNLAAVAGKLGEGAGVPVSRIPVARRFMYEERPGAQGQDFREHSQDLDVLKKRYQTYSREHDPKLKTLPRAMIRVIPQFEAIDREVRRIRRTYPESEQREALVRKLMAKANKLYAEAEAKQ